MNKITAVPASDEPQMQNLRLDSQITTLCENCLNELGQEKPHYLLFDSGDCSRCNTFNDVYDKALTDVYLAYGLTVEFIYEKLPRIRKTKFETITFDLPRLKSLLNALSQINIQAENGATALKDEVYQESLQYYLNHIQTNPKVLAFVESEFPFPLLQQILSAEDLNIKEHAIQAFQKCKELGICFSFDEIEDSLAIHFISSTNLAPNKTLAYIQKLTLADYAQCKYGPKLTILDKGEDVRSYRHLFLPENKAKDE